MWIRIRIRIRNTGKKVSLRKISVTQAFQYVLLPSCFYPVLECTDTSENDSFSKNLYLPVSAIALVNSNV
jgi:hypothetical protein